MGGCCSRNDDTASQQGSNGYGSGGGQRLGGSSNAGGGGGQRLGGGGGGGGPRAFTGQGNTLGGGGVDSDSGVSAGEAAAMAAMQRENSKQGAGASERDRKMADRRKRDELIGKIEAHYQATGKDAPISLASCNVEQLQRHLQHVKQDSAKAAKTAQYQAAAGL